MRLRRRCWLNRGLIGEFGYIPGLYNPYQKNASAMSSGIIYDLTRLPGFAGRDGYSADGLMRGVHAGNLGGNWSGPNRPGGFGKTWNNTLSTTGWLLPGYWGTTAGAPVNKYVFGVSVPFAAFAWVFPTSAMVAGNQYTVVSNIGNAAPGTNGWAFYAADIMYLDLGTSPANVRAGKSTKTISQNRWHHVGFSYDGSNSVAGITFYIDGANAGLATDVDQGDPGTFNAQAPAIWASSGRWPAYGDQVRIYNRTVGAREAKALYDESRAGSPTLYNRLKTYSLWTFPTFALLASDTPALSIAELSSVVSAFSVIDSPTISISDASGALALTLIVASDSPAAAIADSGAICLPFAVADSATAAITESASGVLNAFGVIDAPAARVSEAAIVAGFLSVSDSPAAAISDATISLVAMLARSDSPTVVVSESSFSSLSLLVSDTPTAAIVEAASGVLVALPTFDGFGLRADELGPVTPLTVFLSRADSPTVVVNDASQMIVVVGVIDAPTAIIADASAVLVPRSVTDSPAGAISENSSTLVALPAKDQTALSLAESLSFFVTLGVVDSPAVMASDASALRAALGVSDSPTAVVGDASALTARLTVADSPAASIADASSLLVMLTAADSTAVSASTTVVSIGGHTTTGDYLTGSLSII